MATTFKKSKEFEGQTSVSWARFKTIVSEYWEDNYVTTNNSTIVVDTYIAGTSSNFWYGGDATISTTCDGQGPIAHTQYYYNPSAGTSWNLLHSETFTVGHTSDGTKSISVSVSMSTPSSSFSPHSASVSGTMDLTTIPRASTIKAEKTYTWWNTGSKIDSGFHIGITKYSNSFYQKLRIEYLNVSTQTYSLLKNIANIEDGDSVSFTTSELDSIYLACIPQTNSTICLKLYTYSDSAMTQQIGSVSTYYMKGVLTVSAPTFLDFDYVDTNTTTKNLTNDSGATIIKGYSTLKVSIPVAKKATANTRQTAISHYIVDGETVAYSSSSEVSKSFSNYDKDNISVYAVDNRNTSSAVVNKSFTALNKYVNYTNVFKNDNQSYSRSDGGVGEFVTLNFSGSWWGDKKFGTANNAVTNSISAKYKFRVSGTSTWSSERTITLSLSKVNQSDTYYTKFSFNGIVNGDLQSNGFDVSKSYDIIVTVQDRLSSVTYNFAIHSGEPAIALYGNKASMGAKYDETLGGTQLWGNIYINGNAFDNDDPIIETDTNNDGTYITFYDGTLICYKTVTASVAMTTAWGSLYEGTMALGSWAASFIATPHVQVTNVSSSGAMIESYDSPPTTSSAGTIFLARGNSSTSTVTVNVLGIGRWK